MAGSRTSGLALLLLLSTLSGASYSLIKIGVETIPPVTLIGARTLIAGGVLLTLLRWRGLTLPCRVQDWKRFAVQASLHSALPFTLLAWAQQHADAAIAVILNSTAPILVFAINALTRCEPVRACGLLGAIIGLAGVCFVVGFAPAGATARDDILAYLAIIGAAVCYAGSALFSRSFRDLDPMVPATGSLICGAVVLIPMSLILEHPWQLTPSSSSVVALLALSLFATALTFTIYFRLVRIMGPVATTAQSYLRVPIGVLIAVIFLGEHLSSTVWAGLVLIMIGVAAMTIPDHRTPLAR